MPIREVPFDVPDRSVDQISLTKNLYLLQDGWMDKANRIHGRPGLKSFVDFGTNSRICLNKYWAAKKMSIVVTGGNIYSVTNKAGAYTLLAAGALNAGTRVSCTEIYDTHDSKLKLFLANGGSIIWTDGITYGTVTGGIAPTHCFKVTSLDEYLLCTDADDPYVWKQSVVGEPTNFGTGATSYSDQVMTDEIVHIDVNNDKVYVFSNSFAAVYYDTGGDPPFAPVPGGVINWGAVSSNAVAMLGDLIFMFSPERDLWRITNFTPANVSEQYAMRLQQGIAVANDVEFDMIKFFGGRKWLVMNFNDAGISIVYDVTKKAFYEWGTWQGRNYTAFKGRCYSFATDWRMHTLGDGELGILWELSPDCHKDGTLPIRVEIVTGNYAWNNFLPVDVIRTYVDVKRGVGAGSADPQMQWQVKDNRSQAWSNQTSISLGPEGDTGILPSFFGGRYMVRSHRFIFQDDAEFLLNGLYEEVASGG